MDVDSKRSIERAPRHAIVLGGSMAGLLTAAALAKVVERVTVLERDELPEGPIARRGVPQARHLHGLLPRGAQAIDALLPGYTERLVRAGAARGELVRDSEWFLYGRPLARAEGDLWGVGASRPLIEAQVRRDVRAVDNVRLLGNTRADALIARGMRVYGVRARCENEIEELDADLVVDCRGRAANVEEWLSELGAPLPRRTEVRVDIGYWSGRYRIADAALGGRNGLFVGTDPTCPRGGALLRVEGQDIMVLLASYAHEGRAPRDASEMTAFAATLSSPAIHEVLRAATPLDAISQYRVRTNVRRHFEQLAHHPDGYVVLGDAHTAFNPVYGQGMTVAALAAIELQQQVALGGRRLAARFYGRVARPVDIAWQLSTSSDLRMPTVQGERSFGNRWLTAWIDRVIRAGWSDPVITRTFLGVTSMVDSPLRLVAPDTMHRVLFGGRAARRSLTSGSSPMGATP